MKVLVLGAGLIGVTTAYRLAEDGHQVTVIDRREGPALETSYANGGQLGACEVAPWAGPEVPGLVLRWLGRPDAPFRLRPKMDPAQWRWLWQFLRCCRASKRADSAADNLRLALLSRREFDRLHRQPAEPDASRQSSEPDLAFDFQDQGILRVFRTSKTLDRAIAALSDDALRRLEQYEATASDCVDIEPALAAAYQQGKIAGGIYSPGDRSGDAHLYTKALAARAAERGVLFRYGVTAINFKTEGNKLIGVRTSHGILISEVVVASAGVPSVEIMAKLGLSLPIYPVKGYSVTLPANQTGAPKISIADENRRLVISRFGGRLRAAGLADVGDDDLTLDETRGRSVLAALQQLFPEGGDAGHARFWCGLRPMTPDGRPLIGWAGTWSNLILNTGHGSLGWTLAHGSAALVADLIAGRQPAVPLDPFRPNRWGRP